MQSRISLLRLPLFRALKSGIERDLSRNSATDSPRFPQYFATRSLTITDYKALPPTLLGTSPTKIDMIFPTSDSTPLLRALEQADFDTPTPIQAEVIPHWYKVKMFQLVRKQDPENSGLRLTHPRKSS